MNLYRNTVDNETRVNYLEKHIFKGLTDLNNGFDADSIKYFSKEEFEIVLERIEERGLGIYGIEPFKNGGFYGVWVFEEFDCKPTDATWYRLAFQDFADSGEELQYSATYYFPENFKF